MLKSSESNMQRSQSMGALDDIDSKCMNPKVADFFAKHYCNDHKHSPVGCEELLDSLNESHDEILDLKRKNLELKDLVEQQQNILKFIKEDKNISYRHIIENFLQKSMKTMDQVDIGGKVQSEKSDNEQAKSLLAAIELKGTPAGAGEDMKDAIAKLEHKFQNSIIEIRYGRNADHNKITETHPEIAWESPKNTFNEKFNHGEKLDFKSLMRRDLFPDKTETNKLNPLSLETEYLYAEELKLPPSPLQPEDPGVSVIDHLMQSAVINKKISEGDFNGCFEVALSHCNLALVMSACRAVDPARVFNPCGLSQAVLLSLVQQLATDMLHETQLKCRYLEEALINLDVSDHVTREHLPLVVGEVRKHLSRFALRYPHHVANRRISLIIMAADNLIK